MTASSAAITLVQLSMHRATATPYYDAVRIELTHCRSPSYFRAIVTKGVKRSVRRLLIGAAILASFGMLGIWTSQGEGFGAFAGCVILLLGLLLPLRARSLYMSAGAVPSSWSNPRTWIITDEALKSSSEATSSRWTWEAVRRAEVLPEAYVLWSDGPALFDMPREPMSPDQEADFRGFPVARGLLDAAK